MDLATIGTIGTLVGVAMAIGGVCYHVGYRISWAESREETERLKGKIDKLTTEIVGLKKLIEIAEANSKYNENRWADAQRKADKTEEALKVAEKRIDAASVSAPSFLDRTALLEVKSSVASALLANTSTTAILSSGPVLFILPPEGPKRTE
jgi:hypothetical protein